MTEVWILMAVSLRRLLRVRGLPLVLAVMTVVFTGLQAKAIIGALPIYSILLALAASVYIMQAYTDSSQGLLTAIMSTGVSSRAVFAGRVLSIIVLFLTLYLLHSVILYIL